MEGKCAHIRESNGQLWLSDGRVEVAASLDHGIRISHLSLVGEKNLMYEQPANTADLTTPEGWRVYGGQRFWLAPESAESYYPDNDPVVWETTGDGVWLHQAEDPWLHVKKSVHIRFLEDGRLELTHRVENTAKKVRTCALWAVSTLASGGRAMIPFSQVPGTIYNPSRTVALWGDTNLHDPRLHFTQDTLTAEFLPMECYLKLGLSVRAGRVMLENLGQRLTKEFAWQDGEFYPDGGCNFELYLCKHMMELETLGPMVVLRSGECATHTEHWTVEAL